MSMLVSCTSCGKQLKVRDELIGKKLKCPGCGTTFDAKVKGGATVYDPKKAAISKQAAGPKVAIAWGPILGIAAVVAVIAGIVAFIFGPVAAKNEWEAIGQEARDTVDEVISRALQAHLSQIGVWNPRKPGNTPRTNDDTIFAWQMLVRSMPESIEFYGSTIEGGFKGRYFPKTREVQADVGIGGTSLGGLGVVREGTEKIKVTGRKKDNDFPAEINGKPAEIRYPPKADDE